MNRPDSEAGHAGPLSWGNFPASTLTGRIHPDEVHVWEADLDDGLAELERAHGLLHEDERRRASAFVHERDRSRFVLARGLLRFLLGSYLQVEPQSVAISYGEFGKPRVDGASAGPEFNLSHAGSKALYAFARDAQVGVDVESSTGTLDLDVASLFSVFEQDAIRLLAGDARRRAFFRCWTRKEAYGKALGRGLGTGLDDVSVLPLEPVGPDAPLVLARGEGSSWYVHDLPIDARYAAALAVGAENRHRLVSRRWRWPSTR
jgi:4'-phosphopantetheinyl transferase